MLRPDVPHPHPPPLIPQRAMFWRAEKWAVTHARADYRAKHRPWTVCDRCIETFAFPSQWRAHARQGCRPKHVRAVLEARPPRRRFMAQGPQRATAEAQVCQCLRPTRLGPQWPHIANPTTRQCWHSESHPQCPHPLHRDCSAPLTHPCCLHRSYTRHYCLHRSYTRHYCLHRSYTRHYCLHRSLTHPCCLHRGCTADCVAVTLQALHEARRRAEADRRQRRRDAELDSSDEDELDPGVEEAWF
jgi:hypothetical protein